MWFLVLIMKLNSWVFWDFWLCFEDCLVFVTLEGLVITAVMGFG